MEAAGRGHQGRHLQGSQLLTLTSFECHHALPSLCSVPGIGHRIKSKDNRDKRVELLQRWGGGACGVECACVRGLDDNSNLRTCCAHSPPCSPLPLHLRVQLRAQALPLHALPGLRNHGGGVHAAEGEWALLVKGRPQRVRQAEDCATSALRCRRVAWRHGAPPWHGLPPRTPAQRLNCVSCCCNNPQAANLVLNVDGCIGALFLDLLSSGGRPGHSCCRCQYCRRSCCLRCRVAAAASDAATTATDLLLPLLDGCLVIKPLNSETLNQPPHHHHPTPHPTPPTHHSVYSARCPACSGHV